MFIYMLALFGFHGLLLMEFKWWFEDYYLSVMLWLCWMNVTRWVRV